MSGAKLFAPSSKWKKKSFRTICCGEHRKTCKILNILANLDRELWETKKKEILSGNLRSLITFGECCLAWLKKDRTRKERRKWSFQEIDKCKNLGLKLTLLAS